MSGLGLPLSQEFGSGFRFCHQTVDEGRARMRSQQRSQEVEVVRDDSCGVVDNDTVVTGVVVVVVTVAAAVFAAINNGFVAKIR